MDPNYKKFLKIIKSRDLSSVLFRGAAGSLIINVSQAGITFVSHIFLARLLGKDNYGDYVYVFSWLSILLIFSVFGFDKALIRYLASYRISENWDFFRGLLHFSRVFVLSLSTFLAAITIIMIISLGPKVDSELFKTFIIASLTIPFLAIATLQQGAINALKMVVSAEISLKIVRPLLLIGFVAIIWLIRRCYLLSYQAMTANFFAVLIAMIANIAIFKFRIPIDIDCYKRSFDKRRWINMAVPALFIASMMVILRKTDIIMTGILIGLPSAGIYNAATRISGLVSFGILSVITIAAPIFAELYSSDRKSDLQRIVRLSAKGIFILCIPLCLFLIIYGKIILGFFGSEFKTAYWALVVLVGGQLINAVCGPVGYLLIMTGYQTIAAKAVLIAVIINLILNYFLIPQYGIIGAATATTLSFIIWNIIMLVLVMKILKINPTVFTFSKGD